MVPDIRYALRSLLRTPGFTAVAVVTLALGIGGATVIFSVVDGILLRPLPYPEAASIVRVSRSTAHGDDGNFSAGDFLDVAREASSLALLAGFSEEAVDVTGRGEAIRVPGMQTTAAFFDVFRVAAMVGRVYDSSDEPGRALAVISEGFWNRQFGRRADIVGIMVRTEMPPAAVASVVRSAVTDVDADLPIGEVRTMGQIIDESTGQPRFRTSILLAFAALALLLAAVGVYGLMSFAVSQRTAEMGVRLALGASRWQVGTLVLSQGVWLAVLGAGLGVALALLAGRGLSGLLFETSVTDPAIYAGLTALLLTIAALACYVPARRAMRVDPVRALRAE